MDYRVFFEELRDCHKENGVPFRHEWPLRAYADIKNSTGCYSPVKKSPVLNKMPKANWASYHGNKKSASLPIPSGIKKNSTSVCGILFDQDPLGVYAIALNLARKIGRLPDSLHNRMALSIDRHPSILQYLEEFGV